VILKDIGDGGLEFLRMEHIRIKKDSGGNGVGIENEK